MRGAAYGLSATNPSASDVTDGAQNVVLPLAPEHRRRVLNELLPELCRASRVGRTA